MPLRVPLQRFDERLRRLRPLLLRARPGLGRGRRRRGWLPRGRLLDRGEQVPKRLRRQNRVIRQPNSQPLLRPKQQLHASQRVQPRLALDRAVGRQRARFPLGMKLPRQFERELEKRRLSTYGQRGMRSHVHGWAALTPYCRIVDLNRTTGARLGQVRCKSVSEVGRGVGGLLDRPVVILPDLKSGCRGLSRELTAR